MQSTRFLAIENILSNQDSSSSIKETYTGTELYNTLVFDDRAKKKYLIKQAYESLLQAVEKGEPIDRKSADFIANGMKNWAIDNGATYYTHWFQPLTGKTAEKHDSFFEVFPFSEPVNELSGKALIQQEPDASSFPTGGLRSTNSARGYSVWDPSCPPFIMEIGLGKTLCIPAIFISYTGEALDLKTPLLKSAHFLEQASKEVCKFFDETVERTFINLGWEQEYFAVDEGLFNARPDLVLCGRTLFGSPSARGQQFEDHYFGSIPRRVFNFMIELEQEALKLGIPIKTRHNEVAPSQFEFAPHFELVSIATDHNQLLMDIMDRIAKKHKLRVLLHEKPYNGINGSGKHNNWSISNDKGQNLLEPGKDPLNNLQFLTFYINIVKAVHTYADLLRASIANIGNEHRLGANEAPPAIISVFSGDYLRSIIDDFLHDRSQSQKQSNSIALNVAKISEVQIDTTDRNRTSPFPFTGNKFEFRAVGSSVNVSNPMTVLNTIVGDQLVQFKKEVDRLIENGVEKTSAIKQVLRRYIKEAEPILFDGDNYSKEWIEEAERRGLSNIKTTAEALQVYLRKEVVDLFSRNSVLSEAELKSRYNVFLEEYIKKQELEAVLCVELAQMHYVPAAITHQNNLITNYKGLAEIGLKQQAEIVKPQIEKISQHIESIFALSKQIELTLQEADSIHDEYKKALVLAKEIKPKIEDIRASVDSLETVVSDNLWPFPKYRELLFIQ